MPRPRGTYDITEWAKASLSDELLIYMTSDGKEGLFILNGMTKPVQTVTAQETEQLAE